MNIRDEYDELEKDLDEAKEILGLKEENMNVHQIIEKYLADNGYDGLCNPKRACGCYIDDLFPYDYDCDPAQCQPGYNVAVEGGWKIKPDKENHVEDVIARLSILRVSAENIEAVKDAVKLLKSMDAAISLTLEENRHLADGDNCTLWRLKQIGGKE
jgi:hypothetical protein